MRKIEIVIYLPWNSVVISVKYFIERGALS
jgi:hypothetical protein